MNKGFDRHVHARLHRLPERYCHILQFGNLLVVAVETVVLVTAVEVSEVRKLRANGSMLPELEVLFSDDFPGEVAAAIVAAVSSDSVTHSSKIFHQDMTQLQKDRQWENACAHCTLQPLVKYEF